MAIRIKFINGKCPPGFTYIKATTDRYGKFIPAHCRKSKKKHSKQKHTKPYRTEEEKTRQFYEKWSDI